jgi:hypothetical protein
MVPCKILLPIKGIIQPNPMPCWKLLSGQSRGAQAMFAWTFLPRKVGETKKVSCWILLPLVSSFIRDILPSWILL